MTENERKEAIRIIKSECYISDLLDLDRTVMVNTALDMAIDALNLQPTCNQLATDCIMLTREAYSDLCLRAAGLKSDFKEMLLDINYAIEDGDGFQLDEWLEKLEEMYEKRTETHECESDGGRTHEERTG